MIRLGDIVVAGDIPALFKVRWINPDTDEMVISGYDKLGITIANLDVRGMLIVRRSQLTLTNPQQETLL